MIKPFGRQILIQPNQEASVLQYANNLTDTGVVVAIGDNVATIKVGNKIAFNGYGAQQVKIDGVDCHFCKEDDDVILAVYE